MIKFPFVKHATHPVFEYNRIDDYIYIGTNQCCQTHFEQELLNAGVVADLSLEAEHLDAPFGVKFFSWLPTLDHEAPNPEQLKVGVDFIDSLVGLKQKIYVHCKNGHGRAPTMVAAYYIAHGLSVEEAVKKIQVKRATIHLNENQLEALDKFSKV